MKRKIINYSHEQPHYLFISVTLLLNGALAHAQLLFPVKSGWIESVTIKNPGACGWPGYATSIAVRQECAEVMAIEDGVHVTSFRVEGELYVLTRAKYFTAYGPLDTFYIPRLQKFQRGAVVGILNTTGKGLGHLTYRSWINDGKAYGWIRFTPNR